MLRQLLGGDSEMNNNINGVSLTSAIDPFHWAQFPANSSVSGTSELFSSTFAMLSGETAGPFPDQWNEQKPMMPSGLFLDQTASPIVPGLYDPSLDNAMQRFEPPQIHQYRLYNNTSFMLPYQQTGTLSTLPLQQSQLPPLPQVDSKPILPFCSPPSSSHIIRPSPSHPPTVRQEKKTSIRCSPLNQTMNNSSREENSPHDDNMTTDNEGPDDVRVMCLACKGVYPSRRSLTGHIGRNEKCREIIGRNYLDQVAAGANPVAPGTESALKAGALTNGQDGLSPVCPYCDRFISHYKGNIRRHINQCGKNSNATKRPRPDKDNQKRRSKKRPEEMPNTQVLHEGFEPLSPTMNMLSQTMPSYMSSLASESDGPPAFQMHVPLDSVVKKESETPDDAYICDQCEFVTIYKGNMKRHLNTCHTTTDCKDLKEWDRKLESMRASALGISKEEMMDRLNTHKLNSTRGRKPRSKNSSEAGSNHRLSSASDSNLLNCHQSQDHMMMSQPPPPPAQASTNHYNYNGYL